MSAAKKNAKATTRKRAKAAGVSRTSANGNKAGKNKASKNKANSKKPVTKKVGAKKTVAKKAVTKEAVTKKASTKKPLTKKSAMKKAATKKTATKKSNAKKTRVKKPANQNKTVQEAGSPTKFIASIEHKIRQRDAKVLLKWFTEVTGLKPRMWGSSIIGYGRYYYRYDSGRSGECMITGYSPRAAALSIYIMPGYRDMSDKLARLGRHKIGKSCLYVTNLDNIDLDVLAEMVLDGVAYMRANYKTWDV